MRRATKFGKDKSDAFIISIHALREESDTTISRYILLCSKFQSTLSARRATGESSLAVLVEYKFQSTLSARRATSIIFGTLDIINITFQSTLSARRATAVCGRRPIFFFAFQSTLSARRATITPLGGQGGLIISIHALREESDRKNAMQMRVVSIISIHALREESDLSLACWL